MGSVSWTTVDSDDRMAYKMLFSEQQFTMRRPDSLTDDALPSEKRILNVKKLRQFIDDIDSMSRDADRYFAHIFAYISTMPNLANDLLDVQYLRAQKACKLEPNGHKKMNSQMRLMIRQDETKKNIFREYMENLHKNSEVYGWEQDKVKVDCFKRLARAQCDISAQDCLLRTRPVFYFVMPSCKCTGLKTYWCHHCCKLLVDFVVCRTCGICVFCDMDCYMFALIYYHRWECLALKHHMFSAQSIMAIRMLCIAYHCNFFSGAAIVDKGAWVAAQTHNVDVFVNARLANSGIRDVHAVRQSLRKKCMKMVDTFWESIRSYQQLAALADNSDADSVIVEETIRLLIYVAEYTDFAFAMNDRLQLNRVHLILKLGSALMFNYLQVRRFVVRLRSMHILDKFECCISERVFYFVDSCLKRISHSCDPNAMLVKCSDSIFLKTLRNIKTGELITVNFSAIDTKPRIHLGKSLNLSCRCDRCRSDLLYFQNDYDDANKCECGGRFIKKNGYTKSPQCNRCARVENDDIHSFHKSTRKLLDEMVFGDLGHMIQLTEECDKYLFPTNNIYDELYEMIYITAARKNAPEISQLYLKNRVDFHRNKCNGFTLRLAFILYSLVSKFADEMLSMGYKKRYIYEPILEVLDEVQLILMFHYFPKECKHVRAKQREIDSRIRD